MKITYHNTTYHTLQNRPYGTHYFPHQLIINTPGYGTKMVDLL